MGKKLHKGIEGGDGVGHLGLFDKYVPFNAFLTLYFFHFISISILV